LRQPDIAVKHGKASFTARRIRYFGLGKPL
jgi:hypothetical protein